MVLTSSDCSSSPLVSVQDDGLKSVVALMQQHASPEVRLDRILFRKTRLLLPQDKDDNNKRADENRRKAVEEEMMNMMEEDVDSTDSSSSVESSSMEGDQDSLSSPPIVMPCGMMAGGAGGAGADQTLYLPWKGGSEGGVGVGNEYGKWQDVDEVLRCIPAIAERSERLLRQPVVPITRQSRERYLYVGQGEVAHAVSHQCDVLVSDRATTCHILALRSTSQTATKALSSLTHLDGVDYSSCIRDMIQHHKTHHGSAVDRIDMHIHIVGGFDDDDGSSRDLSNWLLHLLADIAAQEQGLMHCVLQTCAITGLNDTGYAAPRARGLALHVPTGQVFLAKVDSDATGPCHTLRSARLWSRSDNEDNNSGRRRKLSIIHTQYSHELVIEPFAYRPKQSLECLLCLPDPIMLQYTSTSPDCEEEDFCPSVRSTLIWMRDVPCRSVFGAHINQPVRFQRFGRTNMWQRI